jgi:hypothetical protein
MYKAGATIDTIGNPIDASLPTADVLWVPNMRMAQLWCRHTCAAHVPRLPQLVTSSLQRVKLHVA